MSRLIVSRGVMLPSALVVACCAKGSTDQTPRTTQPGSAIACAAIAKSPPPNTIVTEAIAQPFYERPAARGSIETREDTARSGDLVRDDVPNCRVTGVIDGTIAFELLMPDAWNGKFMMGGGGGFAGSVQNAVQDGNFTGGRTALERGYATAGTDTGHTGSGIDASWALANDRAKQDFAHRAVHRTAEISKQIITAYYHRRPQYSYFGGCSRGGGQGLTLAQRYPHDFDGIIAGAPTLDWTGMIAEFLRNQQAVFPDPRNLTTPAITAHNLRLLADAVRKRCDGLDEVLDGVINDPRRCKFDPASLPICALTPGPHCLTQKQLDAIKTIYSDLVIAGRRVYPGLPFGGEDIPGLWDRWITRADPPAAPGVPNMHHAIATQFAKYFVFEDPSWTYASYDFSDWLERAAPTGKLLDAKDPDLRKFKARGGKLIMFHGWSDPALPATRTIEYFEAVANVDPQLSAFARLYLMPGVGHCRGGVGPDRVDWITALENWVERDHRPNELVASKFDAGGMKLLDRPLCPYPDVAQYDRIGNVNTARSFRCVASRN